jgi:DNA-binding transcriptional LysR family regulator
MSGIESIDVEQLRWFVAVAEELHFARAAKSLNIARRKLSETVIALETDLGTKLFVPGASPTQLTDAGAALLRDARERLAHGTPAVRSTPRLRVGFVPGVTVSKWSRIWEERFPAVPLEIIGVAAADQLKALRDSRVDANFVRLPIDRDGISAIPLYSELPVVVVSKDHPVALYDEVTTADLEDEQLHDATDLDDIELTIELVAAGVGVVVVPHSIARLHTRRDLVARTVTDMASTDIALAWPTDRTTDLIEEFVGIVRGRSERSSRAQTAEPKRRKGR